MKCGKAAGLSGIIAEVLKSAGKEGELSWQDNWLFSAAVWSHQMEGLEVDGVAGSFILNLYEGYHGLKLKD